jgi:hypothetical protein
LVSDAQYANYCVLGIRDQMIRGNGYNWNKNSWNEALFHEIKPLDMFHKHNCIW